MSVPPLLLVPGLEVRYPDGTWSTRRTAHVLRQPRPSGSPGAFLRRGPLRTRRATFTAPGSSRPEGQGLQECSGDSDGGASLLAVAASVRPYGR
jgi:hypothetical protein